MVFVLFLYHTKKCKTKKTKIKKYIIRLKISRRSNFYEFMNKDKLLKLLQRKTYWEKQQNKCLEATANALYWTFFTTIIFFVDSPEKRIEKIKEAGWSFVGIIYSIVLISILIMTFFHFFRITFLQFRIQECSRKLAEINQQLVAELKNYPIEVEWK